jgi:hypothetical protein
MAGMYVSQGRDDFDLTNMPNDLKLAKSLLNFNGDALPTQKTYEEYLMSKMDISLQYGFV